MSQPKVQTAAAGDSAEETLRKLHDALDLAEACLKRLPKKARDPVDPLDLLLQIRSSVSSRYRSGASRIVERTPEP